MRNGMNKVAFVLLLASSPAWAAWKNVGKEDNGTTYADPATVVKSGGTVRMWSLLDYNDFQRMVEVGYFSQKSLVEYDCKAGQTRGLNVALHAEHMGNGKVIYADESPHEWEVLVPGTMGEVLWKFACK